MKIKKLTKEKIFKISELLSDEVYDYKHYSERQELTVKFYKILKKELRKEKLDKINEKTKNISR